jgi:hypothetical protein
MYYVWSRYKMLTKKKKKKKEGAGEGSGELGGNRPKGSSEFMSGVKSPCRRLVATSPSKSTSTCKEIMPGQGEAVTPGPA